MPETASRKRKSDQISDFDEHLQHEPQSPGYASHSDMTSSPSPAVGEEYPSELTDTEDYRPDKVLRKTKIKNCEREDICLLKPDLPMAVDPIVEGPTPSKHSTLFGKASEQNSATSPTFRPTDIVAGDSTESTTAYRAKDTKVQDGNLSTISMPWDPCLPPFTEGKPENNVIPYLTPFEQAMEHLRTFIIWKT